MPITRSILKTSQSQSTLEGAGVRLHRAFGFGDTKATDPFLLLDDFRGDAPADYIKGFPWHPHRGIETITYVLAGNVEHGDSMGNKGVIGPGDVQWMTAGSGIIHQEMPTGDPQGRMYGFQLWANLPRARKMTAPRYQGYTSSQIPEVVQAGGARIRVICGELDGVRGPVEEVSIDPEYLDVELPAGLEWTHAIPSDRTAIAYVFEGDGLFDPQNKMWLSNRELVIYANGDQVNVRAGSSGLRFLLISGRPLHEPVAWYGPIVMNTAEELQTAMHELRDGTFIKAK